MAVSSVLIIRFDHNAEMSLDMTKNYHMSYATTKDAEQRKQSHTFSFRCV